jgi:hypothetical protein
MLEDRGPKTGVGAQKARTTISSTRSADETQAVALQSFSFNAFLHRGLVLSSDKASTHEAED